VAENGLLNLLRQIRAEAQAGNGGLSNGRTFSDNDNSTKSRRCEAYVTVVTRRLTFEKLPHARPRELPACSDVVLCSRSSPPTPELPPQSPKEDPGPPDQISAGRRVTRIGRDADTAATAAALRRRSGDGSTDQPPFRLSKPGRMKKRREPAISPLAIAKAETFEPSTNYKIRPRRVCAPYHTSASDYARYLSGRSMNARHLIRWMPLSLVRQFAGSSCAVLHARDGL
jgi:hypothetical protein